MAILKFYSKLINNILPHYFETFTPNFFAGHHHYNFKNPSRLLPKIKHEFSEESLRYKLIATYLNETSYDLLKMAKSNAVSKKITNFVGNDILTGYSSTCISFLFVIYVNEYRFTYCY